MNKVLGFIIILLLIIVGVLTWLVFTPKANAPTVNDNIAAPSESMKQKATAPTSLHERVVVTSPKADSIVAKTFEVRGEAPGNWYFEATFPIQVRDKDGNKIGQAIAHAESNWMTTELVPFTSTMTISNNYKGSATVVLLRDNPSGLPENDDALEIPITIM